MKDITNYKTIYTVRKPGWQAVIVLSIHHQETKQLNYCSPNCSFSIGGAIDYKVIYMVRKPGWQFIIKTRLSRR